MAHNHLIEEEALARREGDARGARSVQLGCKGCPFPFHHAEVGLRQCSVAACTERESRIVVAPWRGIEGELQLLAVQLQLWRSGNTLMRSVAQLHTAGRPACIKSLPSPVVGQEVGRSYLAVAAEHAIVSTGTEAIVKRQA